MKKKFEIIKRKEDVIEVEARVRVTLNDFCGETAPDRLRRELDRALVDRVLVERAVEEYRDHVRTYWDSTTRKYADYHAEVFF